MAITVAAVLVSVLAVRLLSTAGDADRVVTKADRVANNAQRSVRELRRAARALSAWRRPAVRSRHDDEGGLHG